MLIIFSFPVWVYFLLTSGTYSFPASGQIYFLLFSAFPVSPFYHWLKLIKKDCLNLLTALFPALFPGFNALPSFGPESIRPFNRLIARLNCFDTLKGRFCSFTGIKKGS